MDVGSIFIIAGVVVVFIAVAMAVRSVPQGMEYTVERFGRYTHTMRPGLNLILDLRVPSPPLETIILSDSRMNVRTDIMANKVALNGYYVVVMSKLHYS